MPHHQPFLTRFSLASRLRRWRKVLSGYGLILFVIFIALSGCALYLLRSNMVNASHQVGLQLAQRISASTPVTCNFTFIYENFGLSRSFFTDLSLS